MACWHSMSFHNRPNTTLRIKLCFVSVNLFHSQNTAMAKDAVYITGLGSSECRKTKGEQKQSDVIASNRSQKCMTWCTIERKVKNEPPSPWQTCFYRTPNMQHYMMWTSANRILMRLCVGKTFWKKKSIFHAKDIFIVCCIYHVGIMR